MAVGTIVLASATVIEASSASAGTYNPISDLNTINKGSNRQIDSFPVFQRETAHQVPGAREVTLTLNGYLSAGDTGQDLVRSTEAADGTVFVKTLPDGTNGESQGMRVGSREWSADASGGLQPVSFECAAAEDAVAIGSGLTF